MYFYSSKIKIGLKIYKDKQNKQKKDAGILMGYESSP